MSALSNAVLTTSGLVSYWRMGDISGTTAIDEKGVNNGTHTGGTLINQPSLILTDVLNSCAFYDAVNDGTKISQNSSLDITGTLSIEAWVKPTSFVNSPSSILSKYNGTNNGGYEFDIYNSGGQGLLRLDVRGGGSSQNATCGLFLLNVNLIYHVVVTYNDSTNTITFYVNGAQQDQDTTISQVLSTISSLTCLGARSSDGVVNPDTLFFNGYLDEIAIYNVVLSAANILTHYNAGVIGLSSLLASSIGRRSY